jgi:hypothetical protein
MVKAVVFEDSPNYKETAVKTQACSVLGILSFQIVRRILIDRWCYNICNIANHFEGHSRTPPVHRIIALNLCKFDSIQLLTLSK